MNTPAIMDRGSWLNIGVVADRLNMACNDDLKYRYGGGWVTAGDDKGVIIRLGLAGRSLKGTKTMKEVQDE